MIVGTVVLAVIALLAATIIVVSFPKVIRQRRRDLAGKGSLAVAIHVDMGAFMAEMERWEIAFKQVGIASNQAAESFVRLAEALNADDEVTR